ncbi:hypothetical protein GeomeDRAFT_1814 [Geobacter metallireducens RCH3]|uniref:hypothetical protein n=1 Tax=Geobacter metallireducens TaxID=28232 RepID=UPI0000386940|nr:hypothetical protein [Geobacter metallireducens]EHP86508.1 hypothetical protein GeomeDRAFT_1814 [Geobacter metallireducens RCH3]
MNGIVVESEQGRGTTVRVLIPRTEQIERALASARTEPTLFPQHLPPDIRVQIARAAVEQPVSGAGPHRITQSLPRLQDFRETVLARAEKEYLRDLLSLTGSDLKEACRIAGLSLSRLYALLSKHGIKPS